MSGCAEWQAIGAAAQAFASTDVSIHLATDYLAAVRALQGGREEMLRGKGVSGGMVRNVAMHAGVTRVARISMVEAHPSESAVASASPWGGTSLGASDQPAAAKRGIFQRCRRVCR